MKKINSVWGRGRENTTALCSWEVTEPELEHRPSAVEQGGSWLLTVPGGTFQSLPAGLAPTCSFLGSPFTPGFAVSQTLSVSLHPSEMLETSSHTCPGLCLLLLRVGHPDTRVWSPWGGPGQIAALICKRTRMQVLVVSEPHFPSLKRFA